LGRVEAQRLPNSATFLISGFDYTSAYNKIKSAGPYIRNLDKSEKGLILSAMNEPNVSFQISPNGKITVYFDSAKNLTKAKTKIEKILHEKLLFEKVTLRKPDVYLGRNAHFSKDGVAQLRATTATGTILQKAQKASTGDIVIQLDIEGKNQKNE
jgi:hypothetical protein